MGVCPKETSGINSNSISFFKSYVGLMYLQDNKLFRFCQVRNEDIDMSYVALYIIYILYITCYITLCTLNNLYVMYFLKQPLSMVDHVSKYTF